ncbi:MFS transporter [Candidatus Woesearchaeota archaeon]|nr:MFS transporter [Candidatus Woesearchaeota archaeon]
MELTAEEKKQRSLEYSIKDGAFYSAMTGFGDSYITPFALLLKASSTQIGMLATLPLFISSWFMVLGARLVNTYKSRKRIVLYSVFFHACWWILLFLIPYWTKSVTVLLVLFTAYWIFGNLPNPAWNSWMGDLVEQNQRGRYFGRRNRVTGFFALLSVFAAGYLLNHFSRIDPFLGFGIIFGIASLARFISFYYLSRKYEPGYIPVQQDQFSFLDFLRRIRETNFGIFSMYVCLMIFAVHIFGPFLVVLLLRDLGLSYLQYSLIISVEAASNFLMMAYWGKNSDTYGNKLVLSVCGIFVSFIPLLYVASTRFSWLLVIAAITGFSWAGFNLSTANFIFDTVRPSKRAQAIAYFHVLRGAAIFGGAVLGSVLAAYVPATMFISNIIILGIISGVLRLAVSLWYLPLIQEVRIVKASPPVLHFVTIMPVAGLVYQSVFGMRTSYRKVAGAMQYLSRKLKVSERMVEEKKRFFMRY